MSAFLYAGYVLCEIPGRSVRYAGQGPAGRGIARSPTLLRLRGSRAIVRAAQPTFLRRRFRGLGSPRRNGCAAANNCDVNETRPSDMHARFPPPPPPRAAPPLPLSPAASSPPRFLGIIEYRSFPLSVSRFFLSFFLLLFRARKLTALSSRSPILRARGAVNYATIDRADFSRENTNRHLIRMEETVVDFPNDLRNWINRMRFKYIMCYIIRYFYMYLIKSRKTMKLLKKFFYITISAHISMQFVLHYIIYMI